MCGQEKYIHMWKKQPYFSFLGGALNQTKAHKSNTRVVYVTCNLNPVIF